MIFTLEALQAEQGDCLILHFGSDQSPQFVLIDGGPEESTYSGVLEPRLKELRAKVGEDPLNLPLVVCSHIDDDHIGGLLELFRGIESWPHDVVNVDCLWHNSFSRLFAEPDDESLAAFLAHVPEIKRFAKRSMQETWENTITENTDFMFAVSSVDQGNELYTLANDVGTKINCGFDKLVVAPANDVETRQFGDLRLTVLGPDQERLDDLRREWHTAKKALLSKPAKPDDRSVTNLSSIVFLIEYEKRRALVTGDARSDYICDGLERAGLLQPGTALAQPLDILKIQHHGSGRNTSEEFFARVPAHNYVISANGKDGNPDDVTLEALVAARGQGGYRLWLTNYDVPGRDLKERIDRFRHKYQNVHLELRPRGESSVKVDLGTTVSY